ncbi:tetratricopeptide repeat protein [Streptomyces sp. N2-109]|uniref:Tetratricopeptide repeat protein n=1 Tax=Streptomyces gossypii TaxID=2883101 RepID=A0ABT2K2Q4_9ACTN|nr:tetratricopeptide repeat protein [Streptomyces gossypii]MCT2594450.1 tetratricopeptide repeat protein [Streptomyces gossypii]
MTLPDPAASRALLIGVHEFARLGDLPAVRNNAPALERLLTTPAVSGLPPGHCHVVQQPTDPGALGDNLYEVAEAATDTLIVYYSGHGLVGDDGTLHLALPDSWPGGRWHRSLRYDVVRDAVVTSPARRKVVIIDCCYSGRALNAWMSEGTTAARVDIDSTFVLTATAEDVQALCPADEEYSALTGELIRVLEGGIPGGPAELTMEAVHDQLYTALRDKGRPLPQHGPRNRGAKIVLAANPAHRGPPPPAPPARRDTLIAVPDELVGREAEIDALTRQTTGEPTGAGDVPARICLVHGMGGVGKTALLRETASRLAERYPDARFEVDLQGWTPGSTPRDPHQVLGELLQQCGYEQLPAEPAARAEEWRGWLSGRSVLLILDNARDAAQVRPLLPGARAHCLTLIASRDRLTGLTRHATHLRELSEEAAVQLLWEAGDRGHDPATLRRIARLCGCLPLALRPVGALLRDTPAEVLLSAMSSPDPLRHIPDVGESVRLAFATSYEQLPEDLRSLLRHCAWHPGPDFGRGSLEAMTGLPEGVAGIGLGQLVRRSMLLAEDDRLAFHDLFLEQALTAAAGQQAQLRTAARYRLYEHLLTRLDSALDLLSGGGTAARARPGEARFATTEEAIRWLRPHTAELEAAAKAAGAERWGRAAQFAGQVNWWLLYEGQTSRAESVSEAARLSAVAQGSLRGEARALRSLGEVARRQSDTDLAQHRYAASLDLFRQLADPVGQGGCLWALSQVASVQGWYEEASEQLVEALALYRDIGDRTGQADSLRALGGLALADGALVQAACQLDEALDLYGRIGNSSGQADCLLLLGHLASAQEDVDAALRHGQKSLALYRQLANRLGQATALTGLGRLAQEAGDPDRARAFLTEAHTLAKDFFPPAHPTLTDLQTQLAALP